MSAPLARPDRRGNPTVVFTGPGRVEIEERPVPDPGPGEVLIESRATLISTGTELTVLGGGEGAGHVWRRLARYPYVAGYSNVGEVVAVGEGVDGAWIGRRVDSHSPHAAFAVSPAGELRPVPDGVDDATAVFTTLAEVVMNGLRRAGLTWGESVAVTGMGLLGQLAARLAAAAGARPVFAVEPAPERLRHLPGGGVFRPVAGVPEEVAGELVRANGGRGVDVVVEASGHPGAVPGGARLLRSHGRLVVISSPTGSSSFDFHDLCNRESLTILGAHYFSHPPRATPDTPWTARRHGELFLDLVAGGDLDVTGLVTHRFPGPQAAEAYALLAERRVEALGVLLEWQRRRQ